MTEIQFKKSWQLARHFGHGWAEVPMSELEGLSLAEIEAKTRARCKGRPTLHLSPQMAGENVFHTTATGRLEWEVAKDGAVTLRISRKGYGVVLAVRVEDGRAELVQSASYCIRHVEALVEALSALTDAAIDCYGLMVEAEDVAKDLVPFGWDKV